MHNKHLFEYAVVRIVPKVEREEFLNVGVILYCKDLNFLSTKIGLNTKRLFDFSPLTEVQDILKNLNAFEQIAKGNINGSGIEIMSPLYI